MSTNSPGNSSRPTRPLSPHLSIYRRKITSMMMSITHRATGMALAAGTILVAWCLTAIASGPEAYAVFHGLLTSTPGTLVLTGFVWALFYHLSNGVKHLFWDTGRCLDIRTADLAGWAVIAASITLTAAFWWLAA